MRFQRATLKITPIYANRRDGIQEGWVRTRERVSNLQEKFGNF